MQQQPEIISEQTTLKKPFNVNKIKAHFEKQNKMKKTTIMAYMAFFLSLCSYIGYDYYLDKKLETKISEQTEHLSTESEEDSSSLNLINEHLAFKTVMDKDDWDKIFILADGMKPYSRNFAYMKITHAIKRRIVFGELPLTQEEVDNMKYAYNKIIENTEKKLHLFLYDVEKYPNHINDMTEFGTVVGRLENPIYRLDSLIKLNSHFEEGKNLEDSKSKNTSFQFLLERMVPIKVFLDNENLLTLSQNIKAITKDNPNIKNNRLNYTREEWDNIFSKKMGKFPSDWFIYSKRQNTTPIFIIKFNKYNQIGALEKDLDVVRLNKP